MLPGTHLYYALSLPQKKRMIRHSRLRTGGSAGRGIQPDKPAAQHATGSFTSEKVSEKKKKTA